MKSEEVLIFIALGYVIFRGWGYNSMPMAHPLGGASGEFKGAGNSNAVDNSAAANYAAKMKLATPYGQVHTLGGGIHL